MQNNYFNSIQYTRLMLGLIGACLSIMLLSGFNDSNTSAVATATYSNDYIGEIAIFPYGTELTGWHRCDGSQITKINHPDLVVLLGNRFGGDGVNTAHLPLLQSITTKKADGTPNEKVDFYIHMTGDFPAEP